MTQIIIELKVESGIARPISNNAAPGIPATKIITGILMKKVANSECIIANNERLQLLKNALNIHTKHTPIQSKL